MERVILKGQDYINLLHGLLWEMNPFSQVQEANVTKIQVYIV